MELFLSILLFVALLSTIFSGLGFIVRLIIRRPKKQLGITAIVSFVLIFVLAFALDAVSCKGEYIEISRTEPTCTTPGEIIYECEECGDTKSESIEPTGHTLVEISRVEPTADSEGKVVERCSVCGEEVTTTLNKLPSKTEDLESEETAQTDETNETSTPTEESSDIVVGDETILNFYDVLANVGIDRNDAKDIKKIDDWSLGPRYSFSTHGTTARVYCTPDGTIQTLKIGTDINLYKLGYEPWTIDNFIVDESWKEPLISKTQEAVATYLNYPASADFALLDWSFGRCFNQYTVKSQVEAKNGFGVSDNVSFTAVYYVEGESAKLIYLELNGNAVKNEMDEYPQPERKEAKVTENLPEDGTIHIVDGQLGTYGKKVQLDSYEYEWYMVPAGKYKATSNVKTCTVYVDKDEITRNSDGYVEMQNVATYTWNYGETIEIEIQNGEHLFNVYGADYVLTPIS